MLGPRLLPRLEPEPCHKLAHTLPPEPSPLLQSLAALGLLPLHELQLEHVPVRKLRHRLVPVLVPWRELAAAHPAVVLRCLAPLVLQLLAAWTRGWLQAAEMVEWLVQLLLVVVVPRARQSLSLVAMAELVELPRAAVRPPPLVEVAAAAMRFDLV